MNEIWNFVTNDPLHTQFYNFDLRVNPFSSIKGTQKSAKNWAENLLYHNKNASVVYYMRKNGRKLYMVERIK